MLAVKWCVRRRRAPFNGRRFRHLAEHVRRSDRDVGGNGTPQTAHKALRQVTSSAQRNRERDQHQSEQDEREHRADGNAHAR